MIQELVPFEVVWLRRVVLFALVDVGLDAYIQWMCTTVFFIFQSVGGFSSLSGILIVAAAVRLLCVGFFPSVITADFYPRLCRHGWPVSGCGVVIAPLN